MRLTRRGWGAGLAGLWLVGLGVLGARPVLLVGGAIVGAWLLAWGHRHVRAVARVAAEATVEQRPHRDRVAAGSDVPISLYAGLPYDSPLSLVVESRPPVGTSVRANDLRRIHIDVGERRGRSTYHATWPHAGRVAFEAATVSARDPLGVFETTVALGPAPTVTVEPRTPRRLHVGAGGEPVAAAYGEHAAGARGAGLDPVQLRPYLPGDAADRIDWKATARLAEPFVREFEIETDRRLALVVDHRSSMAIGPPGETKLDYAREVALAVLAYASGLDDPLACVTVGDEALTRQFGPDADRRHYARVRDHLATLEATGDRRATATTPTGPAVPGRPPADRLADDSAFASTLRPYVAAARPAGHRVEGDPLYAAVETSHGRLRGPVRTVLITDDTDPSSLRRTVRLARRGEGRVLVYLTPGVLFDPGGLGDLESAYDRYVAFEDERRALARLDRVEAYEVAPGDRIETVLAAGRQRRQVRGGGS